MLGLKDLGLSADPLKNSTPPEERCTMCKGVGRVAVPGIRTSGRFSITCGVCDGTGLRNEK
jgi:hypothetical protein